MIGQKNLIKQLEWMIEAGCFPRFTIITGEKGSGKKTLARHLYFKFKDIVLVNMGVSVDAVRDIITNAYKVHATTVYLLADADTMSLQAKNALLKVTEEPPNNAYFIMTLEDINNTLDTIRSRAAVYQMERYTPKELQEYAEEKFPFDDFELYADLCDTPGDVNLLYEMGGDKFYDYVKKVVGNIATVNGANVFKIADKVSLKDGAEGYNLRMFWKAFISVCVMKCRSKDRTLEYVQWLNGVRVTSEALKKLAIKGVNKQALFDSWILDIRKEWM